MKKWVKNTIGIILYLIVLFLGASVIKNLVDLILKDSINKTWTNLIKLALIFVMIMLLSETRTIKNLQESIFRDKFRKKR